MTVPEGWRTLREIDTAAGRGKGDAFRTFKRRVAHWHEGRDFAVLDPQRDAEAIAGLRAMQRVYATSISVVLVAPAVAETLIAELGARPPGQR